MIYLPAESAVYPRLRVAFEQFAENADDVGDRIDVIMYGGIERGANALKAPLPGAKEV